MLVQRKRIFLEISLKVLWCNLTSKDHQGRECLVLVVMGLLYPCDQRAQISLYAANPFELWRSVIWYWRFSSNIPKEKEMESLRYRPLIEAHRTDNPIWPRGSDNLVECLVLHSATFGTDSCNIAKIQKHLRLAQIKPLPWSFAVWRQEHIVLFLPL